MEKIKEEKGFTATDIVVSLIIITIFISIIVTVFYNYFLTTSSKNRLATATSIIIDVIENTQIMEYDTVTQQSVNQLIENLKQDNTITSPYTVNAVLEKYNETQGNTDKEDRIKKLTVSVTYTVGNKNEKQEMSTLITK